MRPLLLRPDFSDALRWDDVEPEQWLDFKPLRKSLAEARHRWASATDAIRSPKIIEAVQQFRNSGVIASYRDLRLLCAGVGYRDEADWCVLIDRHLFGIVTAAVDLQSEPRRRLKCFRGLLMNYWSFPYDEFAPTSAHRRGWGDLRAWLWEKTAAFSDIDPREPSWFRAMRAYRSLLTDNPFRQYAGALLSGDRVLFDLADKTLHVPGDSWFYRELVFAPIKQVVDENEQSFKAQLARILELMDDDVMIKHPKLRRSSVALVLSRYARCENPEKIDRLQDLALDAIGNPWLDLANWDAYVQNQHGVPDERPRQMIDRWLKRRLIKDFFEMLTTALDKDRLAYWSTFESLIDDMWFAIGLDVQNDRRLRFREFRKNAAGRLVGLSGGGADNNAFIMKIGKHIVIEFGKTGNACFLYNRGDLPQWFLAQLNAATLDYTFNSPELKQMAGGIKLSHNGGWPDRFDEQFVHSIGQHVAKRMTPSAQLRSSTRR